MTTITLAVETTDATTAAERLRVVKARIKTILDQAAADKAAIDAQAAADTADLLALAAALEDDLIDTLKRAQAADPNLKTLTVDPITTVTARQQPDQWTYDDKATIAWARDAAPQYIRTKEELNKAGLKKSVSVTEDGRALDSNGEIIPGVTVAAGEVRYEVKVAA